jgi:CheY-like chemotaxis protein
VKTILVVEDEPVVMNVLRRILKQYRLIEAITGEAAILCPVDPDQRIDLLISDLTLPRLSGIQVALSLRVKLPDLPVILTSGYPVVGWCARDSSDLERLGSHLVTILQKPFSAQVLSNGVCELIGAWQPERAKTA